MKKILLCLAVLCIATPALAAIQQVRVMAVGIDRSPGKAEALAIDYAKKRAVYLTARKMPVDQVSAKVAAFTPEDFHAIVRGAEIIQMRREGERTYADVTVSIVDTALKRALGLPEGNALEEAPVSMRAVLVLPVYIKGGRPYLWEKENELRDPLRGEVLRQAHGAVMVPAGDLDDLRLIDYANALSVTSEELKPMFGRYGADEIVIAIFTPASTAENIPPDILLRRLTPTGNRAEKVRVEGTAQASGTQLRDAATLIATAVTQIASTTAAEEQERLADATKVPITFKYANPRELAEMQEGLRAQKQVLMVELPAIGLGAISGTAYVTGDPQKLREKLRKTGMIVTDSGKGWQLSLR